MDAGRSRGCTDQRRCGAWDAGEKADAGARICGVGWGSREGIRAGVGWGRRVRGGWGRSKGAYWRSQRGGRYSIVMGEDVRGVREEENGRTKLGKSGKIMRGTVRVGDRRLASPLSRAIVGAWPCAIVGA
ncbi:uncharacterized protein SCHCODRAFT_02709293 [Schizophyllum commune H4-8]|uniref:uncharacterized protein n=1 Tax=Schizophyllum commune (strain H4-8 / FGSC 9210) TaxID=578458 RepID=UPI00215F83CB|nr:uncharacterized protein SCHCODRAFT_02709293 [Schizophyllum commune H4-8]KAI5899848.1 hypothetical protein SCHCODRAFT_02709293 [Schizophyllum commune H4-8]